MGKIVAFTEKLYTYFFRRVRETQSASNLMKYIVLKKDKQLLHRKFLI